MRLYLDENIPVLLAPILTTHGFDCLTTQAAGTLGWSDEEQLAFAHSDRRILCTFNCQDFHRLAGEWQMQGRSHAGIILSKSFCFLNCFDVSDTSSLVIGTATSRTKCYGLLLRLDRKVLLIPSFPTGRSLTALHCFTLHHSLALRHCRIV
jgi:hypothetical protein